MIFPSSSMNYYGAFVFSWISPSKKFKNLQINVDLCMYTVIWIITLLIFSFDIGDVFSVQNVMDNDWLWVVAQKDNKSGLVPYALMEELVSRLHQLNESDFTLLFIIPNFVFIPSAVFAHEITAMHSGKVSNDWEASNKPIAALWGTSFVTFSFTFYQDVFTGYTNGKCAYQGVRNISFSKYFAYVPNVGSLS